MKSPASSIAGPILTANPCEGEKKYINLELWQACAGPLVNLPIPGTHVLYFPQGHSEQVAASMKKDMDAQIPNYPNLPSKLLCRLHNVTLHADPETDEVYAQMSLLPVPSFDKDALLRSDIAMKTNKPQADFFCKTLTASDTSTHGGFSVPRRAAEKIFPPLDFSMQPPAQELCAKDLHDNLWTFRHIYRGQPKRHLLTTGWSLFVSGKRLLAGDSVLFIRDEKQQLLLGIRRANRQPTNLSSSVLSSDSMHIGILAAAAHAAANTSPFTIFYNPRASPSEFVIPLAKYYKAVYSNQISLGMRFRMMFETEESGTRRYMGTITGISDIDPVRWKNSQWRNMQVGWDESSTGERRNRVSIWEIEPVTTPFFFCPPPFIRPKRPRQLGMSEVCEAENLFKRTVPWVGDDIPMKETQTIPGLSLVQWMNMQQNQLLPFNPPLQSTYLNSFTDHSPPSITAPDLSHHLSFSAPHLLQPLVTNPDLLPLPKVSLPEPGTQKAIPKCQPHFQMADARSQLQHSLFFQNLPSLQKPTPTEDAITSPRKTTHYISSTVGISGLTDEIPSCSTSPSMNNCPGSIHPVAESCRFGTGVVVGEETGQSCCALRPGGIESVTANHTGENIGNVPSCPSHSLFPNISQMDNLDTSSSSATSAGVLSSPDFFSYRQQPHPPFILPRGREADLSDVPRNDIFAERPLGITNLPFGKMEPDQVPVGVRHFENMKDANHQELSSSIASQSFGLPDLVFNSVDSTGVNDDGFASHNHWGPQPQIPILRTFTKVYKRGAVGRSIDVTRYSGYEELRHDLARRFGLEGQLEEKQRTGWKLVYVDHENDVLLVGDDPWEEFVNCVRCIRILSPQEVQQMSLDGDFGGGILPNQACSSSEGGECFM